MKIYPKPRFYYRVTESGEPVPGTLVRLPAIPKTGRWREVIPVCCEEPCLSEDIVVTDNILALNNGGCSIAVTLLVNGVHLGDLFIEPGVYVTTEALIAAINTYYNGVVIFTYNDPIMSAIVLGGSIYETVTLNINTICE